MTKHDCTGKIWIIGADGLGRDYPCTQPATIKHFDGLWYCQEHDPDRGKKARVSRQAIRQRRARNTRLAALVTPELAALLERLAEIMPAWGDWAIHCADLDEARVLAARIREALEVDK